ncbi:MAG: hypothetical protein ACXABN_14475 [Candidatus Thorarchaeota archaeon]|jgi:hypothetical protein
MSREPSQKHVIVVVLILLIQVLSIIALEVFSLALTFDLDLPYELNRGLTFSVNIFCCTIIPLWFVYQKTRGNSSRKWLQRWAAMCVLYVTLQLLFWLNPFNTYPEASEWFINARTVGLILFVLVPSGIILKLTGISDWNWSRAELFIFLIAPAVLFGLAWFAVSFNRSVLGIPINLFLVFLSPLTTTLPFVILFLSIMSAFESREVSMVAEEDSEYGLVIE